MTEEYWSPDIDNTDKYPHEAISNAIEKAELLINDLKSILPKRSIEDEINHQVESALREYIKDIDLFDSGKPGYLRINLDDSITKDFNLIEICNSISNENWAKFFEEAAKLVRKNINK